MSEGQISIIPVLQKALEEANADKEKIASNLVAIRENKEALKKILDKPYYGKPEEKAPIEFSEPKKFLKLWDNLDEALGNTILMVMPPSIFENSQSSPTPSAEQKSNSSPVIVMPNEKKEQPTRQAVRGFWSGIFDYRIEKLKFQGRKTTEPIITTSKVTYDPKDVVYQLIPSLNKIKEMYFRFLQRHQSSKTTSTFLVKLGHMRLQEELSKYFNVIYPFTIASMIFQTDNIRRNKLQQLGDFSRVAQAEAMAAASSVTYEISQPVSSDGFTMPKPGQRQQRKQPR